MSSNCNRHFALLVLLTVVSTSCCRITWHGPAAETRR